MSVFVHTRVWATMSNTIKQKYIAFIIVLLFFFVFDCLQRDENTVITVSYVLKHYQFY